VTDVVSSAEELVRRIEEVLAAPVYFREVLDATAAHRYRDVLAAWSEVRTRHALQRDERGRYCLSRD
jgi:hypothetical protein